MLISKESLIGAAALGLGAATQKVVKAKLLPKVLPTASEQTQNLITLGIGLIAPQFVRNPIATAYGAGMVAASVADLIQPYLQKAGLQGVGEVMMGQDVTYSGSTPMMGATPDIFEPAYSDLTSEAGGEMNY